MKVLKFGGTSMADETAWKQVLSIISENSGSVIVVSAISGATNALLECARLARTGKFKQAKKTADELKIRYEDLVETFIKQNSIHENPDIRTECLNWISENFRLLDNYLLGIYTLGELTDRSLDIVSSTGERLSSKLLSLCGQAAGINTVYIDAAKIIKTDSDFGKAAPDLKKIERSAEALLQHLKKGQTPVMGGFYGSNPRGEITTLGRGGSDYSASLVGCALKAEAIEIWTDVDGMFTCDPRHVEKARHIPEISFQEAAELAYFGAKVLHPATIQPAIEKNIPVFIKNTFRPASTGTLIKSGIQADEEVRAIAFKRNITIITISSSRMLMAYGFLARVFATFEKHKVPVDLVTTSEVSISMTVDATDKLDPVIRELAQYGNVERNDDQSLICLVGQSFNSATGIAFKIFEAMQDIPVRMISQGSSDINFSVVVDNKHVISAIQALHDRFFNIQQTI